jgi:hypothetical protein
LQQQRRGNAPLQQAPGGDVAHHVDCGRDRRGHGRVGDRQARLRIDRGQEADDGQPLRRIGGKAQRRQPGAARAQGAGDARRAACRLALAPVRRRGHRAPEHEGHHERQRTQQPPPARPAGERDQGGADQQRERRAERHVGAPQPQHRVQPRRVHQPPDQSRRRQRRQQETHAFRAAQCEQRARRAREAAGEAGHGQDQQARDHGAALAERIRRGADGQPQRHAGQLHQREQEAGLHQADAELLAQDGQRRRQLADVQRRADPRQHDDEGRMHPHAAAPASSLRPVSRSCSRTA